MQKVNQLYGKDVIHQTTGNRIAPVMDIVLDAEVSRIVALVVGDSNLLSNGKVVRWEAVVGVGEVIVVSSPLPLVGVTEDEEIAALLRHTNRITGTTIVSDGGARIGTVGDLFIDEQGAIIGYEVSQGLFTNLRGRKFLPIDEVHAVGKDAVIVAESELATVKEVERGRAPAPPEAMEADDESAA